MSLSSSSSSSPRQTPSLTSFLTRMTSSSGIGIGNNSRGVGRSSMQSSSSSLSASTPTPSLLFSNNNTNNNSNNSNHQASPNTTMRSSSNSLRSSSGSLGSSASTFDRLSFLTRRQTILMNGRSSSIRAALEDLNEEDLLYDDSMRSENSRQRQLLNGSQPMLEQHDEGDDENEDYEEAEAEDSNLKDNLKRVQQQEEDPILRAATVSSCPPPLSSEDQRQHRQEYVGRLQTTLTENLEALLRLDNNLQPSLLQEKVQEFATLIYESMSISSRNYHGVQHVFDVIGAADDDNPHRLQHPTAILAALFHDTVYHHVDGGLTPAQVDILRGSLAARKKKTSTNPETELLVHPGAAKDRLLYMVVQIFGFTPGQVLTPMTGINEYLSAVLAIRLLQPLLSQSRLAQIAVCIEATIPFRAQHHPVTGQTPMEQLHQRMIQINQDFLESQLSPDELIQTIQLAVMLSNQDVSNFRSTDTAYFLDNTWALLPESNASLRNPELFTIHEMMFAVYKMRSFFQFIRPQVIFQQFQGVPTDEQLADMLQHAQHNLQVGRKYVNAKLLALSITSAIATLTGGDIRMNQAEDDDETSTSKKGAGRKKSSGRESILRREHLEEELMRLIPHPETLRKQPPPPSSKMQDYDDDVYRLLVLGRGREMGFDVRRSPLAAYFYWQLGGDTAIDQILQDIQVYPMQTEDVAAVLLARIPRHVMNAVIPHLAEFSKARKERIHHVMENLTTKTTQSSSGGDDDMV